MKKQFSILRKIIQWSIATIILGLSLLHIYGNKAVWAPLDAYCPFGGLETLGKFVLQGKFLEKTQPSNLVLGMALVLTTLFFGGIFCGWICPLGTLQDGLHRLGKFLRLPEIKVPAGLDKLLRLLRFPVLLLVLLETLKVAKLWFADYDPFRIIFGLHWVAEPSSVVFWGWFIGAAFIILSLFIQRFWCKYLCPLGLLIQGLSTLSWFRIRWNKAECIDCDLCNKKCPLALSVKNPKLNSTSCNDCLECMAGCPQPKTLQYRAPFGNAVSVALAGVALFLLFIMAPLLGWWNLKITSDPEDIKGWMTLGTIAEKYHIPLSEIKKELKLPANATADTELRSFEKTIPNFEMDLIREYVARRIGRVSDKNKSEISTIANNSDTITLSPSAGNQKSKTEKPETKVAPSIKTAGNETGSRIGEVKDPEEIRGTMTLSEVSEGWKIPMELLISKLGVPQDIDTKVPIRNLESYGINGMRIREVVKGILKGQ